MHSLLALATLAALAAEVGAAEHVIVISVDGLRPAAIETLGAAGTPTFHRLQAEGAWTHNARTDHDWTLTAANHSTMVTGRPVEGIDGHNYTLNSNPDTSATFHETKGSYVASIFDVAHDHGLGTAFYYSKVKLRIINQSYSATTGAEDTTGPDNGRDKIDAVLLNSDSTSDEITAAFTTALGGELFGLAFVHLVDPDPAGHNTTWEIPEYYAAVSAADSYVSDILDAVEGNPALDGNTVIIVTSDHGGGGGGPAGHGDATAADNYTIPFYVWGPGVSPGADLYALNTDCRTDPVATRVPYSAEMQPIRNGDSANLALGILGLPPVPGSSINTAQDLKIAAAASATFACGISLPAGQVRVEWDDLGPGVNYTVEVNGGAGWSAAQGTWPISATTWTDPEAVSGTRIYRVRADM